jgi:serine/threonine protein kinase
VDGDLTGVILDGRYRVIEPISEGAMGVVYRAERVKLGRIVAIKVLHDELPAELASRQRFEIEATAMAKLEHPNCASVLDVGVHEDKPFVVMDFVSGDNLRDVVAAGPIAPQRAVDIVRQVLSGLAHAHEHNIIHRDIKPANIVLSQKAGLGDHVKILDFGLARIVDTPKLTTGIVVGTPSYMAPEQIRGTLIDHRADLYACGILLFELLTGQKPFVSAKDDPVEVCSMHLKQPPPTLRETLPGVELGDLEAIVAKALQKKPEDRFASAVEFAGALDVIPRRASIPPSAPIAISTPALATETGWAVPSEAKSSMFPNEMAVSAAVAYATPSAGSPLAGPAPLADPAPLAGPAPVAAPMPVAPPPLAGPANVRPVKGAPPAPFSRPTAPSSPRGVPSLANTPPSGPTSVPIAHSGPTPQYASGPATAPTAQQATGPTSAPIPQPSSGATTAPVAQPAAAAFDPSAAIARLEAAAVHVEGSQPPAQRGLPSDFDLSRVIPRGTPAGANEKGLSPAFDLSIAIPSPAIPAAGFDLAIPQPSSELPILERSGATSGPTASPTASATDTQPGVGAPAASPVPATDTTQLGLVAINPRPPASVPAAAPDALTQIEGGVANAETSTASEPDVKATVAFLGAPPAGPSPLEAADVPAVAEPVSLPPPPTLPSLPVTKKHMQIIGAATAAVLVLAIIIGTCSGSTSNKPETPAPAPAGEPTVEKPAAQNAADEQVARINELLDAKQTKEAMDQAIAARKVFPKDPRISYVLGKLYFERQFFTMGLKQFRDTLALDPTYRSDPDLIKAVLKAFLTPADYPADLGAFLRNDIGAPARQYLEEAAALHPRANIRARAKSELAKM